MGVVLCFSTRNAVQCETAESGRRGRRWGRCRPPPSPRPLRLRNPLALCGARRGRKNTKQRRFLWAFRRDYSSHFSPPHPHVLHTRGSSAANASLSLFPPASVLSMTQNSGVRGRRRGVKGGIVQTKTCPRIPALSLTLPLTLNQLAHKSYRRIKRKQFRRARKPRIPFRRTFPDADVDFLDGIQSSQGESLVGIDGKQESMSAEGEERNEGGEREADRICLLK